MADPTDNNARALELFNELWADPQSEAGRALRAKAKEKYGVALPEDAAEPVIAPLRAENEALKTRLDAIEAERAAEKKANEDKSVQDGLLAQLETARRKYNLTEGGLDLAVARMKETGNYTDADAAAAWVLQQQPKPAAPGPYLGPQNIDLFGSAKYDERFALLHKDPMGAFLDAEFAEFTADPAKYCADAGFPYQ